MGTSKKPADKARRSEKSGVYIMVNEHFRGSRNAVSGVFRGARIRSFAKVNLALAVLGRRADGYHDIETVFQAIDINPQDEIEFYPAETAADAIELICENLPGVAREDNLIWKAAVALRAHVKETATLAPGEISGVRIVLRKNIPFGAGLGGGSGDAAATLLGLRRFWNLDVSDETLRGIAAGLGSDVPFFLQGGTALGRGRGEELAPLPDIPTEHLVVIFPGVTVSTAAAYRSLNLGLTSAMSDPRIQRFLDLVKDGSSCRVGIFNDFEAVILPAYPEIAEAKSFLEKRGATATLLSGSGSSVFGFFSDEESAHVVAQAADEAGRAGWRAFPAKTLARSEYFHRMFG
jgi:4-diphosphocytidyl-2-C-methyl-D-erythritol kinase